MNNELRKVTKYSQVPDSFCFDSVQQQWAQESSYVLEEKIVR